MKTFCGNKIIKYIVLLFLFFTSVTYSLNESDQSSFHTIDQQFIEMFGNERLSSFTTKKGTPLIQLPLEKCMIHLVKDHWKELSEEQLIFLLERALTLDHPRLLEKVYREGPAYAGDSFGLDTLILRKGSQKLKFHFFYDVLLPSTYFYQRGSHYRSVIRHEYEWKKAVGFYDPFENASTTGPVFTDFDKDSSSKTRLYSCQPNFEGLLPDLADYVAPEYQKERIVFFHGQRAIWMFLEKIYRKLYEMTFHKKFPKNFVPLRFTLHSSLIEEDLERIMAQTAPFRNDPYRHSLLFVNLHLDAGNHGQNSLVYATENFDQKTNNVDDNNYSFIHSFLVEMFKEFRLEALYQTLTERTPDLFMKLKNTFDEAITDQGYYGRLLVISMPRPLARKLSYFASIDGTYLGISDTVTFADRYPHVHYQNAFVLMLTEELINPEAAIKAGVKIVGFDPAFYWQTEKAMQFEKELDEAFKTIQRMES